jgi:signal transduction histidine kinase
MSAWRRRLAWLPLLALGLALGAALLFLALRARVYDASTYFEDVALLHQIRQLDARWELDAMRARVGLTQSYDALVDPLADLAGLPQQLQVPEAGDAAALGRAVQDYQQALRAKVALMERFKSRNAVLRNSLAFLPLAAEDVVAALRKPAAAAGRRRPRAAQVDQVLLATLIYNRGASEEKAADIETALIALQAAGTGGGKAGDDAAERLALFAAHVRTVLREHGAVTGLLNAIAAAPTGSRIDAIHALLREEQLRATAQLQRYRYYLIGFAAALIALLGYAAARLIRSHAIIRGVNEELNQANEHLEKRVRQRTDELTQANARLQDEISERKLLQSRLVQAEKLASVGQLAAGVAHEINNPLAFLSSNAGVLERYTGELLELLAAYERAAVPATPHALQALQALRQRIDLDFLREDIPVLLAESRGGMARVARIVQDLKEFSHVESEQRWEWSDLHSGIDATLSLAAPELRQVADVERDYAALPSVECLPLQVNQVVMSLLRNAGQAMGGQRGRIIVRTGHAGGEVWLEVADNGCGIADDVLPRIYDPFFSTRGIGGGAGLGLSLAYGIVQAHHGRIEVKTVPGAGSVFRVVLPVRQQHAPQPQGGPDPDAALLADTAEAPR